MVIRSVCGDVEVEVEAAAIANPGKLQVGVEDNQHETRDLKRMTRSMNLFHSPDTQASTHHTFKDTKEVFIRAISLRLGEYTQDVRKAVQDELPYMFTIPARGHARPSTLTQPIQPPAPAGNVLTAAEQHAEQQYQTDLAAYKAKEELLAILDDKLLYMDTL